MGCACQFRHKVSGDDRDWSDLEQAGGLDRQFEGNQSIQRICLRDEDIVAYQQRLPTTRPHLLTQVLADLCWKRTTTDQRIVERTRFCLAPGWRDTRRMEGKLFLELAPGVVEWALARGVDTVSVAIDWRLVVIAMQLRFCVPPVGSSKRIGRDVVARWMAFNRATLATIQEARGRKAPGLREAAFAAAARAPGIFALVSL